MLKDKQLYEEIAKMVIELELTYYPSLLLTNMIYRKVRHPMERTDEIMKKVTEKVVPEEYKKHRGKPLMRISVTKELQNLEEVLHECKKLPEGLENGYIIANTVKYFAKKIMER